MPSMGLGEWVVLFLIVLVLFGPKALPKIGQAIGTGIRELKDAMSGVTREIENDDRRSAAESTVPRTKAVPPAEPPAASVPSDTDKPATS
ncbi:MAG: twin-arginine translocase TatA/TatE family subunit [Candidatus Sumerlaeaceae bacterium]|nr:twin-arginine translocase TatA/TatE family subunit [Candidatus Sumerlaeaceae bacterium]